MTSFELHTIDLHIHTDRSASSTVVTDDVVEYIERRNLRFATVTDFGSLDGIHALRTALPECIIIPAVEVRAPEGDFLIFTCDEDYLDSLPDKVESVQALRRDADTAVIWAHPFVNQRAPTYEASSLPEVEAVAPFIDGLELFNGTMIHLNGQGLLRPAYFTNLMRIAAEYRLGVTAGSDAHEPPVIGRCYTTFPGTIEDAPGIVKAIKEHRTMPHYDDHYFGVRIPLG